jgi:hypothetical protein
MLENKQQSFREDFPGYMGFIPYKKEVIGMTVGSTNDFIKTAYTIEPAREENLMPVKYDDYTYYNKDYFNDNFYRDYKLEENNIYSNNSREASTWINGSKYKIYPQHIPGYKAHVPGIYSSNIHGMGYSKTTAIAIKGDYPKTADVNNDVRFKSSNMTNFQKPKMRQEGKISVEFSIMFMINVNFKI